MPDNLTVALATALVTAALSAFTTYFGMRSKVRYDLLAEYDKDLRERRLTAYGALWTLTEPLARYSPPEPLTAQGVHALSERLRKWYFRDGIMLSADARNAYFGLQRKLTAEPAAAASPGAAPLDPGRLKEIQDASRDLHTALCGDIGSRHPPMIGSDKRE